MPSASSGRPRAWARASKIWSARSRLGQPEANGGLAGRGGRRPDPTLIGLGVEDGPEQPADVVAPALPLIGQRLEHLGGPGRALRAHVVDRLVEGLAHQGVPGPVDERPGEPGVVLAGDVRGDQRPALLGARRLGQGGVGQLRPGGREEEPGRDRDLLGGILLVGHRVAGAGPGRRRRTRRAVPGRPSRPAAAAPRRRTRRTRGTAAASTSRSCGRGTGRTGSARPGRSARPRRPSPPAAPRGPAGRPRPRSRRCARSP